jgi:sulfatase maturation enzyme AslB (radical SAM superfamily)
MTPNLEISTVVGCRMNCDYCPQKIHISKYLESKGTLQMTFHDFKTMLSTVPKNVEIVFAGMAEPWLNKWATDMVLYSFDQGYKVGVYTTTVGMKEEDARRLRGLPFMYFTVHLPDADGLMTLKVTEQYLLVLLMILRGIPDAQKMVVGRLHPEVEKYTGPVSDGSAGLLSRAGNLKTLAINRKYGPLECSACGPKIDHNVLLPNGDVLLCCMDYSQEHVIGNLLHGTYEGLFTSPEYLRVMDGLKDDTKEIKCRYCELAR